MQIISILSLITVIFSFLFAFFAIMARARKINFPKLTLVLNAILIEVIFFIYVIGDYYDQIKMMLSLIPSGTVPENIMSFLLNLSFNNMNYLFISLTILFIAQGVVKALLGFRSIKISSVISCAVFYFFAVSAKNPEQSSQWFTLLCICGISYAISTIIFSVVRKTYMANADKGYEAYRWNKENKKSERE